MICPPLFAAAVQILASGKTVCHCGNRCSWLQYDIKEQGWTCERVCVHKEQAGHLAAICTSAGSLDVFSPVVCYFSHSVCLFTSQER